VIGESEIAHDYAMCLARDCCFRSFEFESDCQSLIRWINIGGEDQRTYVGKIGLGIIGTLRMFSIGVAIKREGNKVAK